MSLMALSWEQFLVLWGLVVPIIVGTVSSVWHRRNALSDRKEAAKQLRLASRREYLKEMVVEAQRKMAEVASNAASVVTRHMCEDSKGALERLEDCKRLEFELQLMTVEPMGDAARLLTRSVARVSQFYSRDEAGTDECKEAIEQYTEDSSRFMAACSRYLKKLRKAMMSDE